MSTRVAVIGGGRSCEHDVSLASAAAWPPASTRRRTRSSGLTIGRDGTWRDRGGRPMSLAGAAQVLRGCDVAFPVVHGPHGEDGTLAALCELAGPAVRRLGGRRRRAGDGQVGDQARRRRGRHRHGARPAGDRGDGGGPAPGPVRSWSSRWRPGRASASRWSPSRRRSRPHSTPRSRSTPGPWSRTSWSAARSTSPCSAGPTARVLVPPALEIVGDGLFDYDAKYGGHADFRVPATLSETDAKALEDAAVAAYDALGLLPASPGSTSSSPSDGPVLNEVNTDPRDDRALPGAADVRGRRDVVRRPPRRAGARRPPVTQRTSGDMVRWPA